MEHTADLARAVNTSSHVCVAAMPLWQVQVCVDDIEAPKVALCQRDNYPGKKKNARIH